MYSVQLYLTIIVYLYRFGDFQLYWVYSVWLYVTIIVYLCWYMGLLLSDHFDKQILAKLRYEGKVGLLGIWVEYHMF